MISATEPQVGTSRQVQRTRRYTGKVVYMYAFDVAYEMSRQPIRELLGCPVAQFSVDSSKRSPKHLFFYRPQMVRLPPMERLSPVGRVLLERTIKILPVGAISITISIPFEVESVEELVHYHDLQFNNGSLADEVRRLASEVRHELAGHFIRPANYISDEEAYTVFCLHAPLRAEDGSTIDAETWLQRHRREVASVLTQEPDASNLSQQETEESTGRYLSYYENDLVVVDWDAALVVEEALNLDEILHVMELANLQLAELEAYDRILDDALERSYRDMSGRSRRGRRKVMRDLREIRIDLARLSDELQNITKFFGDWHLARIYQTLSARFHLAEWHRSIDEKLKTLDDLYSFMNQDMTNRWMLILEAMIVLLFIIDLIAIFLGGPGH